MGKTSTGLTENLAGLLCYILTWVTGVIFLILEKDNTFVRFHAVQSIVVFAPLQILIWIFAFVPVIGWIVDFLLGALGFILWIVLMVRAYQGQRWKVPVLGDLAEGWAGK